MKYLVLAFLLLISWRQWPEGIKLEVTTKHDLGFERDTVMARHYHKSGNKFYVITTDSVELWVDNVKVVK